MHDVTSKDLALTLTFLGAALTIITYLLPSKSPAVVLVLLIAMFVLLFYPVWQFCSSNEYRWLRTLAVLVLAIAVAGFGIYVWPSQTSALSGQLTLTESLTQWLRQSVGYVRSLPFWFWVLLSFSLGIIAAGVVGFLFLRHRLLENVRPRGEILTPLDGEEVGWHRIVRGSVYPADSETQILIRSADGWWYRQREPCEVRGRSWSFNGEFGEKEMAGESYDVIAVQSGALTDDRYKNLPGTLSKSNVVRVNRRLIPDFIDCPDKLLHQTGVDDRSRLRELVKVCAISCDTSHLAEGDKKPYEDFTPYVDFVIWFLNFYLRPVSIELSEGFITYQKDAIGQAYKLKIDPELVESSRAQNCPFRNADCFLKIRQEIDHNQFTLVNSGSKESVFYFQNLKMLIKVEGVDPVLFDVPNVQKGIPWTAPNEVGFIQATIATLKTDHAEQITTLNKEIESLRRGCKTQIERTRLLSEVIGRANELESVHKDPQFIPQEQLKSLAFEIESALNKCYADKVLERFYQFPFEGERMEHPEQYGPGHVQWFIDYRNRLIELLNEEREA